MERSVEDATGIITELIDSIIHLLVLPFLGLLQ